MPDGLRPYQPAAKDRVESLVSDLGAQIQWSTERRAPDSDAILMGTAEKLSLGVALAHDQFGYTLGQKYDYFEGMGYESFGAMTDAFVSQLQTALREKARGISFKRWLGIVVW